MRRAWIGGVAGCALALAACATETAPEGPPPSGTVAEQTVTATATVEKIDHGTRQVTLRRADGSSTTLKVGPEARNLAQVKPGDEVVVAYHESLAYEVRRAGEATPGAELAGATARAKPGEKPAGVDAQQLTVTSTIEAIDTAAGTVTLKGADGETLTTKVRDPEKLKLVRVGDLVELTYTQAIAVSVEPATK
jgi:Cu/Ag efflux protein CusF